MSKPLAFVLRCLGFNRPAPRRSTVEINAVSLHQPCNGKKIITTFDEQAFFLFHALVSLPYLDVPLRRHCQLSRIVRNALRHTALNAMQGDIL